MIKKERPFLGHAITRDGKLRYTSVSAIKMFDPTVDGGCPRKFAYSYRFGIKLARTNAQVGGSDHAEKLEHYLTTGEDVLPPVLQPAKKFFPMPGSDLECEKPLGDIEKAIKLRDLLLSRGIDECEPEVERAAGLTFAGIPVDGAADCRHTRGEFVDSDGILKKDPPGAVVVHVDDLKTTSRIYPHKVLKGAGAGTILPSFCKTDAEVCEDVQMLGYGRHAINLYPGMTHARLSLIYANTTKREAVKRTGIISVEQILSRANRIDGVVRQMEFVATAQRIEDVEPNVKACDAYTHVDPNDPKKTLKGCGYRYQCPLHISQTVSTLLGQYKESAMSLFDHTSGATPPAPSAPPTQAPPLDDAAHAAAVAAEKAKLLASFAAPEAVSLGFCAKCGTPLTSANASKRGEAVTHIGCAAAVVAAPTPPPLPIAVNPPDQPKAPDLVAAAGPVPPEEIAQITDPELKAKVEQHAQEHAARAAAAAAAEEAAKLAAGTSVWCPTSNNKIVIDATMAIEGYTCVCTKHWTIKALSPLKEDGRHVTVIPRHKPVNKAAEVVVAPAVPAAAPAASPYTSAPPVPTAPVVVAPPIPSVPSTNGHTNGHHTEQTTPRFGFYVELEDGAKLAVIATSMAAAAELVASRIGVDVRSISRLNGHLVG